MKKNNIFWYKIAPRQIFTDEHDRKFRVHSVC